MSGHLVLELGHILHLLLPDEWKIKPIHAFVRTFDGYGAASTPSLVYSIDCDLLLRGDLAGTR